MSIALASEALIWLSFSLEVDTPCKTIEVEEIDVGKSLPSGCFFLDNMLLEHILYFS